MKFMKSVTPTLLLIITTTTIITTRVGYLNLITNIIMLVTKVTTFPLVIP